MSLFVILNQTGRSFNCNFKLHRYLINKILIFWENTNLRNELKL
jgi:hypothetical protein